MESRIQIFDTMLRDGEQILDVNFSFDERLSIAKQLEKWGIGVIEAGSPASSIGNFESVEAIFKVLITTAVRGLARYKKSDINAVYEATKCATKPRVHIFIATSSVHLEHKLKMTQKKVLESIKEHVSHAKSLFDVAQSSPEDASRTDQAFLIKSVQTAVDAGTTIIDIPDTVGYSYSSEYGAVFKPLITNVKSEKEIIYSAHCHDDLGMAAADSLAAVENGAKRIEDTANGIGECAGNTALEETILALYVRKDRYGIETKLKLEQTKLISELISRYADIRVPRNKAIVGQNTFSHRSGTHQDDVLKSPETYEIMTLQLVGIGKNELSLGKPSGKHASAEKLKTLGYDTEPKQQIELFKQLKAVADKKKSVSDRDIHAIIQDSEHEQNVIYQVETLQLQYVSNGLQSAVVVIKDKEGHIYQGSSIGTGSIAVIYNAVDSIFKKDSELIDYRTDPVTEGTDVQVEVHVEFVTENQHVNDMGIDHDILQAPRKAYVGAYAKYTAQDLEKVGNK